MILDHYTCPVNCTKFLGIGCVYKPLNEFNLKFRILYLNEATDKYSSTTRRVFDQTTNNLKIYDKIFCVNTDNAPDVKCAFLNDNDFHWLGCTVHQLQLCLKHSFKFMAENEEDFSDILSNYNKVITLFTYVNHSNKQKLFKISLKSESNTRFDSRYLTINSFLQNKNILNDISDERMNKIVDEIDIKLLEKVNSVLKIFTT